MRTPRDNITTKTAEDPSNNWTGYEFTHAGKDWRITKETGVSCTIPNAATPSTNTVISQWEAQEIRRLGSGDILEILYCNDVFLLKKRIEELSHRLEYATGSRSSAGTNDPDESITESMPRRSRGR